MFSRHLWRPKCISWAILQHACFAGRKLFFIKFLRDLRIGLLLAIQQVTVPLSVFLRDEFSLLNIENQVLQRSSDCSVFGK